MLDPRPCLVASTRADTQACLRGGVRSGGVRTLTHAQQKPRQSQVTATASTSATAAWPVACCTHFRTQERICACRAHAQLSPHALYTPAAKLPAGNFARAPSPLVMNCLLSARQRNHDGRPC